MLLSGGNCFLSIEQKVQIAKEQKLQMSKARMEELCIPKAKDGDGRDRNNRHGPQREEKTVVRKGIQHQSHKPRIRGQVKSALSVIWVHSDDLRVVPQS